MLHHYMTLMQTNFLRQVTDETNPEVLQFGLSVYKWQYPTGRVLFSLFGFYTLKMFSKAIRRGLPSTVSTKLIQYKIIAETYIGIIVFWVRSIWKEAYCIFSQYFGYLTRVPKAYACTVQERAARVISNMQ